MNTAMLLSTNCSRHLLVGCANRQSKVKPSIRRSASRWRCSAEAVTVDTVPRYDSQEDIKKGLMKLGWGRAWCDGISETVSKGKLKTTAEHCQSVIDYLERLGIPNQSVCNMCSVVPSILGADVADLSKVVDHLKNTCGATGEILVKLLVQHPKLLIYSVAPDGMVLEYGRARAEVDVVTVKGTKQAVVSYFREGAIFQKSPVSPVRPARV